jgi:hypothetical protein
MPRKCFKYYPNTIGFPCYLCEDMQDCKNYVIRAFPEEELEIEKPIV